MLKDVAQADEKSLSEDRYGIIVELSNLSSNTGTGDITSTLTAAAEAAVALLHVPYALVFVKGADGSLEVGGTFGVDNNPALIAAASGIADKTLRSSSQTIFPNVAACREPFARELEKANIASIIGIPMRVGTTNVGAIVVMSDTLRAFSQSDVELLHVVASQAALASWRSSKSPAKQLPVVESQDYLIQLAQRKIQDLSLINQISEAISSTLDLERLLEIALKQSMMAVGADAGSIMLVNEDTNKLEIASSRGLDPRWKRATSQGIGISIAGWVAEQGESVLVTDAHADPRFKMSAFRDAITSAASVPLKSKSGVIGVLNVNTVQHGKLFDERDLEILGTVANQMAVAIENARLYSRVNRRTEQLGSLLQISRTVSSTLNFDEVLHKLDGEIHHLFDLDVCVILVLDDLSGRFRYGHGSGLKTRQKSVYYDLAVPLAMRVKETNKKLILRELHSSKALRTPTSDAEGFKMAICIPLRNMDKIVGVVVGFVRKSRPLKRSQIDIIDPLGRLAGVAIHNSRVYRSKYRMAELLQQRLTPSRVPELPGLEIAHKFLPAREVGGDYYDFIRVGDKKLGVVVADVAGSDVEAAEYTTMGKHVLRTFAREHESPAIVLTKTNEVVCEDTREEMFISLFYSVIDLAAGKITYSNAGCEPPVHYRASKGKTARLSAKGILLGIACAMSYEEKETDFKPGDVLAIYTDGLTEAASKGRRFGVERVADIVSKNAVLSAREIADSIHDALLEFVHGRVTDDVAIVVLKAV